MDNQSGIKRLLGLHAQGDSQAWPELIRLAYGTLREMAHAICGRDRTVIQATQILHEVLIKLHIRADEFQFEDPAQLLSVISQRIRWKLIDELRKEPKQAHVPFDTSRDSPLEGPPLIDPMDLDRALKLLKEKDERAWMVAELKHYCGLRNQQVADLLGVNVKTVESDWTYAKGFLQAELGDGDER